MVNYLKTTKFKILFLQTIALPILGLFKILGLKTERVVNRKGIKWKLDLTEAIDFCLWLTGDYEPELTKSFQNEIKANNTIVDIGANSGIHTLYLASLVGANGHVHAIEATLWGIQKIKTHLDLNPDLKSRVTIHHTFLTNQSKEKKEEISASWKITKSTTDPDRNQLDQGFAKSTKNAKVQTFDEWREENKIIKIDFIKLDVDGNEVTILEGSSETLKNLSPKIYMELSPIHYEGHKHKFQEQVDLILNQGYTLSALDGLKLPKNPLLIESSIPRGVLVNVLGVKA